MCYFIGSDVILANLLYYSPEADTKGVSFPDIENYCKRIKQALLEKGKSKRDYISFRINRNELNSDLDLYPEEFRKFQGRYYINHGINIDIFKLRTDEEVGEVLESVAKNSKCL